MFKMADPTEISVSNDKRMAEYMVPQNKRSALYRRQ